MHHSEPGRPASVFSCSLSCRDNSELSNWFNPCCGPLYAADRRTRRDWPPEYPCRTRQQGQRMENIIAGRRTSSSVRMRMPEITSMPHRGHLKTRGCRLSPMVHFLRRICVVLFGVRSAAYVLPCNDNSIGSVTFRTVPMSGWCIAPGNSAARRNRNLGQGFVSQTPVTLS